MLQVSIEEHVITQHSVVQPDIEEHFRPQHCVVHPGK